MSEKPLFAFNEEDYTVRVDSDKFGPETQRLYDFLTKNRVIGQNRAARRLARSRSIYNAGLQDDKGCAGAYLFAGPTGVGKTLMGEAFAYYLVYGQNPPAGAKPPLIRIQCGKYKESHRVSELLGAPPSYIGFDRVPGLAQTKIDEPHFMAKLAPILEKGFEGKKLPKNLNSRQLMELYLKHKPYSSVLLFDEVEKAHPDLWNALLHIIDDGELALGDGEITDFSNTYVILTCNVGGRRTQEILAGKGHGIGFTQVGEGDTVSDDDQKDKQMYTETLGLIEQIFAPELVGRLRNEIVVFRSLKRDHCAKILEGLLEKVQQKFTGSSSKSIPITVRYTDEVKEFLLDKGIDKKYGIRPLKKTVHKFVTLKLANAIESESIRSGDEVLFRLVDGSPEVFRKPRPDPPPPKRRIYLPPPKGST